MTVEQKLSVFKSVALVTLIAVYFLILVGGIVRSTGAGMGCPDWPKCFGSWVPPTNASQLPADYKEHYAEYRHQKNLRFAQYLDVLGFDKEAEVLRHDQSILVEADFNALKTWTEYVNRLMGAIIGLLIIATMISARLLVKKDTKLFLISVLTLVVVVFQGWIGSVVVSTNLMPWMITIHMLLALGIILLLIYINYRVRRDQLRNSEITISNKLKWVLGACIFTMGLQIVLGTQVREAIDEVARQMSFTMRDGWVSRLGLEFLVHRSFSLVILALHGLLMYLLIHSAEKANSVRQAVIYILVLLGVEIFSGVAMAYFGIPSFVQPIHLLVSTGIFGMLYFVFLILHNSNKKAVAN